MRKIVISILVGSFIGSSIQLPAFAQVDPMPFMSKPGVMVHLSPEFSPAYLKGIVVHPEDPFKFDFIIYKGDKSLNMAQKKEEYTKLTKYFLASLAIPDDDQWVNLSPYEKDRIIKNNFGRTEMGRDLLAQDYMLKQITASLIYPEDNLGKEFWAKVYAQAQRQYGTSNVPVNTFNKVWILPDDALIYEKGNTAYVLKNHLRVMLEEDYLSLQKHSGIESAPTNRTHTIASKIVKEIVLPELQREVNEDKNFAALRQVYSGMLLATWFKRELKASLLGQIYANKAKIRGVDQDAKTNEEIYRQYLKAYKKGVFNFIKEDVDKYTNETIPRKYFSGGDVSYAMATEILRRNVVGIMTDETEGNRAEEEALPRLEVATFSMNRAGGTPSAAIASRRNAARQFNRIRIQLLRGFQDENDGQVLMSIDELNEKIGKNNAMVAELADPNHLAQFFSSQKAMTRIFNPDQFEALASEWDQENLESVIARMRNAVRVWEGLKAARDANRAKMKVFEEANPGKQPGSILAELAEQTHASWLSGERELNSFIEYTPEINALLIEAARKGALRDNSGKQITLNELDNPQKKYRLTGYNFDAEAFGSQDEWRDYLSRLQKATSSDLRGGKQINTVAADWQVLNSISDSAGSKKWRTERPQFLYQLQADMVGGVLRAVSDPTHIEILKQGTKDRKNVEQALVDILRLINVGWRLNNPWNWKDFFKVDSLLSRPFDLSDRGGVGLGFIIKDALILKAVLEVLNRRLDEVQMDPQIKRDIRQAFNNGLEAILADMITPQKLEEAIVSNREKTEYQPVEVIKKLDKLVEDDDRAMIMPKSQVVIYAIESLRAQYPSTHRIQSIFQEALSAITVKGDYKAAWEGLKQAYDIAIEEYNRYGLGNSDRHAMSDYYKPIKALMTIRNLLAEILEESGQSVLSEATEADILAEAQDIVRRYGGEPDRYDPETIFPEESYVAPVPPGSTVEGFLKEGLLKPEDLRLSEPRRTLSLQGMIREEYKNAGKGSSSRVYAHIDEVLGKLMVENGKPVLTSEARTEVRLFATERLNNLTTEDLLNMMGNSAAGAGTDRLIASARKNVERIVQLSRYEFLKEKTEEEKYEKTPFRQNIVQIRMIYEITRLALAGSNISGLIQDEEDLKERLLFLFTPSVVEKMLKMVRIEGNRIVMYHQGVLETQESPEWDTPQPADAAKEDPAMLKGGIDLNSANLAMIIKRDGNGVVLPLNQQDLTQLSTIQGLNPVILSIRPASQTPEFAHLQTNP